MSNDAQVSILLAIRSDLQQLKDAQREFANLRSEVKEGKAMFSSFSDTLKGGFGLDFGARIAGGVREAVSELKSFIELGVRFNATTETAINGIAGSLRQFDAIRNPTFTDALRESAKVVDSLKSKSREFGLSFNELSEQYQATFGSMIKGGITDLQKQVDISVVLKRTLSSLGIEGSRAVRDIADILNGMANRTVAGKTLGIEDADLKAAAEAGQLYEFLEERLKGFSLAAAAGTQSINVLQERLKENATQVAADQTVRLTESYKELLVSLNELVRSEGFKKVTELLATVGTAAVKTIKFVVENAPGATAKDPDAGVAERVAKLKSDLESAQNQKQLSELRARVELERKMTASLFSEYQSRQSDVFKQTPMFKDTAANFQKQISLLDEISKRIDSEGDSIAAVNAAESAVTKEKEEQARLDELTRIEAEKVAKRRLEIEKEHQDLSIKDMTLMERYVQLQSEIDDAEDATKQNIPGEYAKVPGALAAELQDRDNKLLKLKIEQNAVLEKIISKADEEAAAAKATLTAEEKHTQELRIQALVDGTRNNIANIRAAISTIENDRTLTQVEKKKQILDLLGQERAAILANIEALQKEKGLTENPVVRKSIQDKIDVQRDRLPQIDADQARNSPTSFMQDFKQGLAELQDGFKTIGATIAGTIGSAIQTVSRGITGLITGTMTWKRALSSIATTIITDVIQAIVEMSVQWIARKLIEFAFGNTLRAAALAANAAQATASLAIWSPAAVAASIATFGAADVAGVASYQAAIAGTVASGGWYDGGYTGDGSPGEIAGPAHKGEFYFNHLQTARLGRPFLESLAAGKVQPAYLANARMSPAVGVGNPSVGSVTGSAPQVNQVHNIGFFDDREKMETWMRSNSGTKTLIDVARRAGVKFA